MHRLFTPLLRRFYWFTGLFLLVYASFLLFTHSVYYKERLYQKLVSGDRSERIAAAARLVVFDGEEQLLRALRSGSAPVRDVAVNALWTVWMHAGGKEAYRLTQSASEAADREAYGEAVVILSQVVARYPDFAEGWNQRATLYWQMGKFEQSIADCRKVLALKPAHYGAWQGLGLCQWHLGDWEGACSSWRRALRIAPHNLELRRLLRMSERLLRQLQPAPPVDYDWI